MQLRLLDTRDTPDRTLDACRSPYEPQCCLSLHSISDRRSRQPSNRIAGVLGGASRRACTTTLPADEAIPSVRLISTQPPSCPHLSNAAQGRENFRPHVASHRAYFQCGTVPEIIVAVMQQEVGGHTAALASILWSWVVEDCAKNPAFDRGHTIFYQYTHHRNPGG